MYIVKVCYHNQDGQRGVVKYLGGGFFCQGKGICFTLKQKEAKRFATSAEAMAYAHEWQMGYGYQGPTAALTYVVKLVPKRRGFVGHWKGDPLDRSYFNVSDWPHNLKPRAQASVFETEQALQHALEIERADSWFEIIPA